jgi:hypothetical protein
MQMNFLAKALGLGLGTWAISRMLRTAQRHKRERQPEAVTRWEGEGGSIPDVEPTPVTARYADSTARL